MVLQLVPLAIVIGSSIAGGSGIVAGTVGAVQVRDATAQIKHDAERHGKRHAVHLANVERTNVILRTFGRTQEMAQRDVTFRMRDFLLLHGKQVRANEHLILNGVDESNNQIAGMAKLTPDAANWVRGAIGAAAAGTTTRSALMAAAREWAKSSTGTRINTLHGAAADKSVLAFFGGGSRAAGGGGIKLGGHMLNVASVGTGLLVVGVTVKIQGTRARSDAEKYRTQVDVAIADLDRRDELLRGVRKRALELDTVLIHLVAQSTQALDALESQPFNIDLHGRQLQTALILVKAVRDVATALEDGNADEDTGQPILKYRETSTEAMDG